MKLQAELIDRGDLGEAISVGAKLNAAKREWGMVIDAVKAGAWTEEIRTEVRTVVNEMLATHERLLLLLEPARNKMAEMLTDVRKGRQLLSGYRLTKRSPRLQFEVHA